jgi:CubicO group peptidase (beta-lactamase class C family)
MRVLASLRPRPAARSSSRTARTWVAVLLAVVLLASEPLRPAEATPDRSGLVVTQIDRFLRAQLQDSAVPGAAVAVTRGDRVLMVRGYGHDSTGAAVTGDSLFRIASLSKSFTALAVMQLVDDGRLRLDDPVAVSYTHLTLPTKLEV